VKPWEPLLSLDAHEQLPSAHDVTVTHLGEFVDSAGPQPTELIRAFSAQPAHSRDDIPPPLMHNAILYRPVVPKAAYETQYGFSTNDFQEKDGAQEGS
jgi:hypothetical protein